MPNFKSNAVEDNLHFCKLVHYIHANPVHHRVVSDLGKWKFSSFNSFLVEKETAFEREYVLSMFGGKNGFLEYHNQPVPLKNQWHDLSAFGKLITFQKLFLSISWSNVRRRSFGMSNIEPDNGSKI